MLFSKTKLWQFIRNVPVGVKQPRPPFPALRLILIHNNLMKEMLRNTIFRFTFFMNAFHCKKEAARMKPHFHLSGSLTPFFIGFCHNLLI